MALPSNQRNGMHFQSTLSNVSKDKQKAVKYAQKGATRRDILEIIIGFNAAHPMVLISYR